MAIPILGTTVQADSFGGGINQFEVEFVDIGDPGNPDDTTGNPNPVGSVAYKFRMAKYEISRDMIQKANAEGALGVTMDPMSSVAGGPRDHMPATGVSWFEAATFVNWLNTTSGYAPAYKFSGGTFSLWQVGDGGYNAANPFRNDQAFYFLPNVDEWYKAAYYDPSTDGYFDYPTGSDNVPTKVTSGTAANTAVYGHPFTQGPADVTQAGGLSPYGTMGQGGNAGEWEETESDLVNDSTTAFRGIRGGDSFNIPNDMLATVRFDGPPNAEADLLGFRIASVPEPSIPLFGVVAIGCVVWRRRRAACLLHP